MQSIRMQSTRKIVKLLSFKACDMQEDKINHGKSQLLYYMPAAIPVTVSVARSVLKPVVESQFKSIVRAGLKSEFEKKFEPAKS